ncbi:MAG TPA: thioredoxin domain-containing protein [Candidatus Pristimantibacillus sp.]|jgi:protein-disulfide isomerase|nr:thioredoxin domain-containing protein [Candidatus Pristimantibacillus sp.]
MDTLSTLASPVDGRDHSRGSTESPVVVVEYGDYECPQSARTYHLLKRLLGEKPEMVRLVFRNFPLTQIRPHALPAALAAEAASMQNSFWEMHDILFEHQDGLEPEHLIVYAQVLGLDIERLIIDMTSDLAAARVREDFVSGIRSGVNGTPSLYINGTRYDGAQDYESLTSAITEAANPKESDAKSAAARRHASSRL